ncbi:MAG: large-conductance mechanosensitive channel protein MscL [Oscillospiraceae bacterium]|nr:large-conductance mechanosensitive channel protein MscL [Oscillospiraceae bacterium]
MKKFLNEFKAFAMRGNVFDMAIGVVLATAFGKITNSLVGDVFMPLIGYLFGGVDLSSLNIILSPEVLNEAGEVVTAAVTLGIGTFLTAIIDFILIAFCIFLLVKGMNKAAEARKKEEEAPAPEEPKGPTQEELLAEIRDLLKSKE